MVLCDIWFNVSPDTRGSCVLVSIECQVVLALSGVLQRVLTSYPGKLQAVWYTRRTRVVRVIEWAGILYSVLLMLLVCVIPIQS